MSGLHVVAALRNPAGGAGFERLTLPAHWLGDAHRNAVEVEALRIAGDFVAFRWAGGGPYPAGVTFIKVLAGLPGDEVTRDAQGFHLNGVPVGVPKPVSRRGQPLEPGPTGRIPEGRYYVQAGHPDSLDSRYQLTGWIHASQIIGRADALF